MKADDNGQDGGTDMERMNRDAVTESVARAEHAAERQIQWVAGCFKDCSDGEMPPELVPIRGEPSGKASR